MQRYSQTSEVFDVVADNNHQVEIGVFGLRSIGLAAEEKHPLRVGDAHDKVCDLLQSRSGHHTFGLYRCWPNTSP